jgi:hypothetical protein
MDGRLDAVSVACWVLHDVVCASSVFLLAVSHNRCVYVFVYFKSRELFSTQALQAEEFPGDCGPGVSAMDGRLDTVSVVYCVLYLWLDVVCASSVCSG